VGDAPTDALLVGLDELAKGWLLALLERAPLDAAPNILAADLARDGPRICDAVVRALADDTDLRRLEPGGALEPLVARAASFAGADDPASIVSAVDALQAVIWSAIRAELPWPDPEQISDLAERLAAVCEQVRAAALRGSLATAAPDARGPVVSEAPRAPVSEVPRPPEPEVAHAPVSETPPRPPEPEVSRAPVSEPAERPDPVLRTPEALWVGAVEDEIRQAERSGSALSLLLAELEDGERVASVERATEAGATFGQFAQAVRSVVRREDILACETDTRAWIIARDTARRGAYALGERIAGAVEEAPPWRGAPMTVSVGIAVYREDGQDAGALIEAAEEAKFAAAASGVRVFPDDPSGRGPLAS
jgi:GGDEF domain-containing protein